MIIKLTLTTTSYCNIESHRESKLATTSTSSEQHTYRAPRKNGKKSSRAKTNAWTTEESQTLVSIHEALSEAVKREGIKLTWTRVASLLNEQCKGEKTAAMCHQHYKRVANPRINHNAWTETEDYMLVTLSKHFKYKWAKIAHEIIGRTDLQCRRRWYTLKKSQ